MKKWIGTIALQVLGLGLCAQSFSIDSTYQPFFDIRDQPSVSILRPYENDAGKLFLPGTFKLILPPSNKEFFQLITTFRDGSRDFSFNNEGGGGIILPISDTSFAIGSVAYIQIDTNGNRINHDWFLKTIKTVGCISGFILYFYPDGSSLFSNTADNTGLPCSIINPPDTFPGRHIVKVSPEGLWDSSFVGIANHQPLGFVPYDSTRILVYGFSSRFTRYNGVAVNGICRIFLDGSLDTSFHSVFDSTIFSSAPIVRRVEENGKIMIGGSFRLAGGSSNETLVRLNSDGSLDQNFLNFGGAESTTWSIPNITGVEKTEDKGYLIGGAFTHYQGIARHSIAKLDSNGRLDTRYFTSQGPDSSASSGIGFGGVSNILRSKFGGYYVTGNFLKWDGKPTQPIVRLHGMVVGIGEKDIPTPEVNISPNPSKERFYISTTEPIQHIEVYNLLGKKINTTSTSTTSINLSNQEKGVYLLHIHFKNGARLTQKLIKQ